MKQSLLVGGIAALFFTLNCHAQDQCTPVVDQEQNESTQANFASISQPSSQSLCYQANAVQSFTPTYDNVADIALRLGSVFGYGITFKIGIFGALPNSGAQPISEALVSVEGPKYSHWISASFGRVPVTPGDTYYLGFCHLGGQIAYIEGHHFDPYPNGMIRAGRRPCVQRIRSHV